jgi:hypothetical protein
VLVDHQQTSSILDLDALETLYRAVGRHAGLPIGVRAEMIQRAELVAIRVERAEHAPAAPIWSALFRGAQAAEGCKGAARR